MDLQLLNDAEVIRYPLNQWPIPKAAIQYAVANAKEHFATNSSVIAALARVRARIEGSRSASIGSSVRAGNAGRLRDFDTLAREDGEIEVSGRYETERFAFGLAVTGAADPDDGQDVRLDGSHATAKWGNWLISANALDRWWGPGHESSLIMSNNARPMPTIMVERAEARPSTVSWLQWLGPYRFSFGISQMENDREDIDSPLFMAWRVVVMPFKDFELGFSRTAQFCGDQLSCDLNTFSNMLAGNDNVGFDATPENEPGNQMAGFDMRWVSPIGTGPYAIYAQMIGEDESGYLPVKYLGQVGFEVWKPLDEGGMLQWFVEYADTTCSGMSPDSNRGPFYHCAYNQGRFNVEGYRYRGRAIGHTTDADANSVSLGTVYNALNGKLWSLTARYADLNHDSPDVRNTVSTLPAKYMALELGWKGEWFGEHIDVDLGVESSEPNGGERDTDVFGFIGWRHEFSP
jgi:hypothetical protein